MIRTSKSANNKEKSKNVSVIVPIFNEEKTVENIIKCLLTSPLVNEVICVNDGSTDESLKILKEFGKKIKVVSFIKNYGKGHALAEGIKKSQSEIVVFFDSDLIRFCHGHIEAILDPIFKEKARVVLGYSMPRKNHFFASSPFSINVTGQRAYYKEDLLPHLKQMTKTRYGVEIFLNSLFKKNQTSKIPNLIKH